MSAGFQGCMTKCTLNERKRFIERFTYFQEHGMENRSGKLIINKNKGRESPINVFDEQSKKDGVLYKEVVVAFTDVVRDIIQVPLYYAINHLANDPWDKYRVPVDVKSYMSGMNMVFRGALRPCQQNWLKLVVEKLNRDRTALLNLQVGSGKTVVALKVACRIKLKCLILMNRVVLMYQWKKSVENFTTAECIILEASLLKTDVTTLNNLFNTYDIFFINPINIEKLPHEFIKQFGVVIVDECHLMVSPCAANNLVRLTPVFLIGLSATPYRLDNLNNLLYSFFGFPLLNTAKDALGACSAIHGKTLSESDESYLADKISQTEVVSYSGLTDNGNNLAKKVLVNDTPLKSIVLYKIQTDWSPIIVTTPSGRMDWNQLLEDQATQKERNEWIVNAINVILKTCRSRKILVLVKRVKQVKLLIEYLQRLNPNLQSLAIYGSKKMCIDNNTQVLIGTVSKCGVGFDYPELNTLILASDLSNYFIQYLGRVMRKPQTQSQSGKDIWTLPHIFDIVDKNSVLQNHYRQRLQTYNTYYNVNVRSYKDDYPGMLKPNFGSS